MIVIMNWGANRFSNVAIHFNTTPKTDNVQSNSRQIIGSI